MRLKRSVLGSIAVLALLAAPLVQADSSQGWTLGGTVVSGQSLSPVQGTALKLVSWPTGRQVATATSGPDGAFQFSVSGAGTYSVLAQPRDGLHAEKSSALVRLSESARAAQVSIRLAPVTTSAKDLTAERALLDAVRIQGNVATTVQESDPANLGLGSGSSDIRIISRPPPDVPPKRPPRPGTTPPPTPPGDDDPRKSDNPNPDQPTDKQ